jgi:MerR family transcriptional regulator, copper efflux regulator
VTEAGYRTYTDDDITVLRFIRQAKTLGLSLGEIRDILDIHRGGTAPCRHVLSLLDQRIRDIDRAITELRQLRRALASTAQPPPATRPKTPKTCAASSSTPARDSSRRAEERTGRRDRTLSPRPHPRALPGRAELPDLGALSRRLRAGTGTRISARYALSACRP